eukprot:2932476-Alexandrium_andersonii.AAC.1
MCIRDSSWLVQPGGLGEDLLEDVSAPLRASVLPRCPRVDYVEQDRIAIAHLREGRADELATL